MLFRLLAGTKIANRDGAMRHSTKIDGLLDKFDRNFRAIDLNERGLDGLVRMIEKL
jgi:hypothetical protein